MKLLISPAKRMVEEPDFLPPEGLPRLIDRARRLADYLGGLDYPALKKLLGCNDQIARLNFARYAGMDLEHNLTPALFAYQGIQYQYMAPRLFTLEQYRYLGERLRILSGLYGLLRPFDGVTPYRLEMGAPLRAPLGRDLYQFWGGELARVLLEEGTDTVVDLASKEYSRAVLPHLPTRVRVVRCCFGEWDGIRLREKGTQCKMARGEMVRFLAETGARQPEDMAGFERLGYRLRPELSRADHLIFAKGTNKD